MSHPIPSLPTLASTRLSDEFERVWPWLEASIKVYGNTHRKEDVWRAIAEGRAFFRPMSNAAIVGNIITHPSGLKDANAWLAGAGSFGGLTEIMAWVPRMEAWGREHGCHRATVSGREGWKLALGDGWRSIGVRLAKDLG